MSGDLLMLRQPENVAVVRVSAEHIKDITDYCRTLKDLVRQSEPDGVVVNLAGIRILPSELLSTFVVLHRRARNTIKLCHVQANILETLTRTQLIRLFEVFDDEGSALARLAKSLV